MSDTPSWPPSQEALDAMLDDPAVLRQMIGVLQREIQGLKAQVAYLPRLISEMRHLNTAVREAIGGRDLDDVQAWLDAHNEDNNPFTSGIMVRMRALLREHPEGTSL